MKDKLISILVILLLAFFVDFLFTKYGLSLNIWKLEMIYFLFISFIVFIVFINITYKTFFNFKRGWLKPVVFVVISLAVAMFIAQRYLVISKFWLYSTKVPLQMSNNLWKADDFLSHKGIPNAQGSYDYFIGDSILGKIPTYFDSLGYRTVDKINTIPSDTLNLFLGCSWTFGDFIEAEEGYPYKTSKLLNHNLINAGASAYGLGQMIQLADSLLPKYSFNYVFIQISPWLADRAMAFNGPIYYGYLPFPYFSDFGSGFQLHPKPYGTVEKKQMQWRDKNSYWDKLHFTFTTGMEVELLDYLSYKMAVIKSKLGLIPSPTDRKRELELYFYEYVIEKVKANHAIPIILKLKAPNNEYNDLIAKLKTRAQVIDLDEAIANDSTALQHEKPYHIFHVTEDGQKIFFDDHPNGYANSLFSNYIYKSLKSGK